MKKLFIVPFLLSFIALSTTNISYNAEPIASPQSFTSGLVNPASLGLGNSTGFSFAGEFDEDFNFKKNYQFIYSVDSFAFIYGLSGRTSFYTIANSVNLFRNFYLGNDFTWINSNFKKGNYGLSTLYHPTKFISLAGKVDNVGKSNPAYRLGTGLRPLIFSSYLQNRVTLTADVSYQETIKDGEYQNDWLKPVIGVQTEFFNGFGLSGSYDMESETVGLNLSFNSRNTKIGTMSYFDNDNDLISGHYFMHFSGKDYRFSRLSKPRPVLYDFKVRHDIVDEKEQINFGGFAIMRSNQMTMEEILNKIKTLKNDDQIQGIVFKSPSFRTNYANMLEIRDALIDFKTTGKHIIVYSNNFGNLGYAFMASVADELYLNPFGSVDLKGFSISMPYLAGMLEKIGIDTYDLKSHEHKSGLNIFTESEMTEQEREDYLELLNDFYSIMTSMIEEGRGTRLKSPVDQIVNDGPYLIAQRALDAGLVDELIYEDELSHYVDRFIGQKVNLSAKMPNDKISYDWYEPAEVKIAVINAQGSIATGRGRPGRVIGSETTARQIKKAREDNSVKGIIIRVNSGGGSAFASDIIAREIKKCREANKPVVISMGGSAASGGYAISVYADRIIAQPSTITGSIGVTGFLPSFNRLFDKLYINWSSVTVGENADMFSMGSEFKEEHLEMIREMIDHTYDWFIDLVAEGRGMSREDVDKVARGKIWTGSQALEIGLVDELGGFDTAVKAIKEIGGYESVMLKDFSYQPSRFLLPIEADFSLLNLLPLNKSIQSEYFENLINNWKLFEDETVLLLSPVDAAIIE